MTTPYLYGGADPGLNGAIALWQPGGNAAPIIFDMPTFEITVNGNKKRQLNIYEIARWFDVHGPLIKRIAIEIPNAMPSIPDKKTGKRRQMGAQSAFNFGWNCCAVHMATACQFVPIVPARPNEWKRDMKLTADKDASRRAASQLLPQHAGLWSRVKDDGRAEALLLAVWGSRQQ